jgi:6-pyruvoyltetrahydropterin/6-carboxytetrahydropterin synthase
MNLTYRGAATVCHYLAPKPRAPSVQQFYVRISKEDLVFSAGHFVTVQGDTCEGLHGHNFRVAAEVHGPLDENQYVLDFVALRDTLRAIIGELDHRVLLPTEHPLIRVAPGQQEVEVTCDRRRWSLPRSDCLLLPMPNTTTELLARYVGQRLLDELASRIGRRPALVRIEIEESPGFSAVCELRDE